MSQAYSIEHQLEQQRFVLELDGHQCLLEYQLAEDVIDFTHTYVPFRLRGKGLAEKIVEQGLAWAKAQNYQIKASCWYVAKFIE